MADLVSTKTLHFNRRLAWLKKDEQADGAAGILHG
jgi:hypothetical protein